jgi:hypothetical protein
MFERYLSKTIHVDESMIRLLRPSWLHYRWPIFWYTLALIAALFFLYPLQTLGWIGWVLFSTLFAFACLALLRLWLIRSLTAFVVTNQRVIDIDQKKLFERHVSECTLDSIRDIRYTKTGMMHTLRNIGTVIIETGGDHGHIECQDVRDPESVKELLTRVQHHNKNRH